MASDRLARLGLFLLVFALVALSGPGRIDIVDGDTRYEVARGLVEVGRPVVRDPAIWFSVFPGRDGENYTTYRFPQPALGVPVLWVSDLFGPSEARRRFLFAWIGAGAAGVLAVGYHALFRLRGIGPRAAIGWALAGIACTPAWYYGTSTFDDEIGSAAVIVAMATALLARRSFAMALACAACLAFAYNAKQPLAVFALVASAMAWDPDRPWREQIVPLAAPWVGVAVGYAANTAWDLWNFPPGTKEAHAELQKTYLPVWGANPVVSLACLAFSGGASALLYCPPVVLCGLGLTARWQRDRVTASALVFAISVFVAFISLLTFFKGDPTWGPRYLTPIFAALWVWAPDGAGAVSRRVAWGLLGAGVVVQVLALSVDPHRLYVERGLPNAWSAVVPMALFDANNAHLLQRPREIADTLWNDAEPLAFSPAATPLGAFPMAQHIGTGPAAIREYVVFDTLRPFWIAHWRLPVEERPAPIVGVAIGLLGVAAAGAAITLRATRSTPEGGVSG